MSQDAIDDATSDIEQENADVASRHINWKLIGLIALVALLALSADQVSKYFVVTMLPLQQSVPVIPGFLDFYHVLNPGAAFSFAEGATWVFSIITAAVITAIIVFAPRIQSTSWAIMLAMLLGGTMGNLMDRLFREPSFLMGHVVDFIHISFFPAIFNIADIFIVSSMCIFVLLSLLGINIDGTRTRHQRKSEHANS